MILRKSPAMHVEERFQYKRLGYIKYGEAAGLHLD